MLNCGMKKKQLLIFVLSVLILVIFNKVFMSVFTKTNAFYTRQALINNEEIAPQKLFDKTWKVINREYYEPSLNNQNWYRWKEHYRNKIKTDEVSEGVDIQQGFEDIAPSNSNAIGEALGALLALGYSEKEAENALKKVNRQESVENIIKECLRVLMG